MNHLLNPNTKEAYQLLHDGALALARCEQHGMRVDVKYIKKQQKKIDKRIKKLEDEFKQTKLYRKWDKSIKTETNMYSDDQLRDFLYEVEKYPVYKTTDKGNPSTDKETLQELDIPDLEPFINISKLRTLQKTFLPSLIREQVDGIIHPFFHLHNVISFRGASSDPNFQNFPKRDPEQMQIIRGAIYPSKGHQLLELDYSQLEVRIACCFHKDPTMLKYLEGHSDMHGDMAEQIFMLKKYNPKKTGHKTLRAAAKNGFVFPAFYGDYHVGFAKSLSSYKWGQLPRYTTWSKKNGIPLGDSTLAKHLIKHGIDHVGLPVYKNGRLEEEASGFTKHLKDIERHFWKKRFPVYDKWKDDWYEKYLEDGYFYNKTGFTFSSIMNKKDAVNYPVQSSAFHVLLWSLIQGVNAMLDERWKTRFIGQIHDAIVLDVHPDELDHIINVMKCIMTSDVRHRFPWINVPLEIEAELCGIDEPWSSKQDYNIN